MGTLSKMLEMGRVGPEAIPVIRDGIELGGFLFLLSQSFMEFLKELFINRRLRRTQLILSFIFPLVDLAEIISVRTSLGGWDRMPLRRLCSMILI